MPLYIDIITLFPDFFEGPLRESIIKIAQEKKAVDIGIHDLRDYSHDAHRTCDDKPFGGGPGMVMKPEPIFECVDKIKQNTRNFAKRQFTWYRKIDFDLTLGSKRINFSNVFKEIMLKLQEK